MQDNVTPITPAVTLPDKQRTVTLTNAAPVVIDERLWPVIAEGKCNDEPQYGGEDMKIDFRVRREVPKVKWDGWHPRHLIHGKFYYWNDTREDGQVVRVGRLLSPKEDVEQALREVGEEMRVRVLNEYMHRWVRIALDNCFEKLPPRNI